MGTVDVQVGAGASVESDRRVVWVGEARRHREVVAVLRVVQQFDQAGGLQGLDLVVAQAVVVVFAVEVVRTRTLSFGKKTVPLKKPPGIDTGLSYSFAVVVPGRARKRSDVA